MISWCLFLTICSFASLSYGGMHNDQSKVMKPDGVIMSFEDGRSVVDCVDIYKQPAFQHPLLVNHTIQLEPDEQPSEPNGYTILEGPFPLMNLTQSCPKGSIPIERIDRLGGGNKYLRKRPPPFHKHSEMHKDGSLHTYAVIREPGDYRGAKATINLWNPKIEAYQDFSVSQIWISSGDENTVLEAGWIVYPNLFGDYETRFFIYWTADGYEKTGCYNTVCPGFVQTREGYKLGSMIKPISRFGAGQSDITVSISKGRRTGDWWLYLHEVALGYWPNELVPGLSGGAKLIEFGGEIAHDNVDGRRRATATQMGSGHFPSEGGFRTSSYFKNVRVAATNTNAYSYPGQMTQKVVTRPECYDIHVNPLSTGPWGYSFHYGGPGRSYWCN